MCIGERGRTRTCVRKDVKIKVQELHIINLCSSDETGVWTVRVPHPFTGFDPLCTLDESPLNIFYLSFWRTKMGSGG